MAKEITKIIAENGREFDNVEDAERYERLIAANKAFQAAVAAYSRELASQFKTGDGVPFTFERSNYHYVFEGGHGPRLIPHVSIYGYYCKVSEDGYVYRDKNSGASDQLERYEISQLYVSEKAANEKLLELMQKYHEWANEDIEKLKAKIAKMR